MPSTLAPPAAEQIQNDQAALRAAVANRGAIVGPDGRPFSGPTMCERVEYDPFEAAKRTEERRYQAWGDERRIPATDAGGLDTSWSTRDPGACWLKIRDASIALAVTSQRLGQIEAEIALLSPGEQLLAGFEPPELTAYVERLAEARARAGVEG